MFIITLSNIFIFLRFIIDSAKKHKLYERDEEEYDK